MFRSQPYLESSKYVQINLDTPLTFPANNNFQKKTNYKFTTIDRDNFYDWYNAYFRVDFKFEAKANGANIGADTESAPINGSFSLIQNLKLSSAGKILYEANNIHKGIFIKNLRDFSDDYSRSVAKINFGILTLTQPQRLIIMRRTLECEQERFYHTKVRWLRRLFL